MQQPEATQTEKNRVLGLRMTKQKLSVNVYNANGVDFTIYPITKSLKSGPKTYWVLED